MILLAAHFVIVNEQSVALRLRDVIAGAPPAPTALTEPQLSRIQHRANGIRAVKDSIPYQAAVSFYSPVYLPPEPNPYNVHVVNKRTWEASMMAWRHQLIELQKYAEYRIAFSEPAHWLGGPEWHIQGVK